MRRFSGAAAAFGILLACQGQAAAFQPDVFRSYAAQPSVFGSVAVPSNLPDVQKRLEGLNLSMSAECGQDRACADRTEALAAEVANARSSGDVADTLGRVNAAVNRAVSYVPDGGGDAWSSPSETVARGHGDCEDYAILKMAMLREAGVPAESMAVAVLSAKPHGSYHAVLVVSLAGGNMVLDIKDAKVRQATFPSEYQPLYSLSASRAWLHGNRIPASAVPAAEGTPGS